MKENKSTQKLYPISSSFILFTSKHQLHYICLSTGRKESSSNKHKGNIQPRWKHRHRPFWADFKTKKKKNISGVSWMCETDDLRISGVSRLLSHSGLIGPHGAYTHTCGFMQSQYTPTHPSLLTSSWCCYSMLAFLIVRQWHSLGAHQKAHNPKNEMLVNLSTVAETWTWSVWHNETVRIASPTGIYTLVKFHAALKKIKDCFSTAQATGHCSKRRKKKLTFHYTQIGQYTRCMLPKQFHNVHLLKVDSVNMIFKYNIYRRYNVDLLPLHIKQDTWHLCKMFSPVIKLASAYYRDKLRENVSPATKEI